MMKAAKNSCALLAAMLLTVWPASVVLADDDDHIIAHKLLSEGRIKPLVELMDVVRAQFPGQILEVEFETDDGIYAYEFKLLRPDGKVQSVELDAATGQVRKVEDKKNEDDD